MKQKDKAYERAIVTGYQFYLYFTGREISFTDFEMKVLNDYFSADKIKELVNDKKMEQKEV